MLALGLRYDLVVGEELTPLLRAASATCSGSMWRSSLGGSVLFVDGWPVIWAVGRWGVEVEVPVAGVGGTDMVGFVVVDEGGGAVVGFLLVERIDVG